MAAVAVYRLVSLSLHILAFIAWPSNCQIPDDSVLTSSTTLCKSQYYQWPTCADHPSGYMCHCGPGYFWNTHTCISMAVNSRLEFPPPSSIGIHDYAYTLLLATTFPHLNVLTVAFWIQVADTALTGTVFSYKYGQRLNVWAMSSGPTMTVDINGDHIDTLYALPSGMWTHIAFTWMAAGGRWSFYVNGKLSHSGQDKGSYVALPAGGNFVLGQASAPSVGGDDFPQDRSFVGSLSHFNIWEHLMDATEVIRTHRDCTHTQCGTAVEWVAFRSGTRGTAKLRWPSGVPGSQECFTSQESLDTCDKYCSFVYGIQCEEVIEDNVRWLRTPGDTSFSIPCPGHQLSAGNSSQGAAVIPHANRSCVIDADDRGVWEAAHTESCLSSFLLLFTKQVKSGAERGKLDGIMTASLLRALENYTRHERLENAIDVSAAVNSLLLLVKAQKSTADNVYLYGEVDHKPLNTNPDAKVSYEKPLNYIVFAELFTLTVSHLLSEKNIAGWNATVPIAQEASKLLRTVEILVSYVADSLRRRLRNGDIALNEARFRIAKEKIAMKVQLQSKVGFNGFVFPDVSDETVLGISPDAAVVVIPATFLDNSDVRSDYILVSAVRYDGVLQLLPNPVTYGTPDDNVNSAIMSVNFYHESGKLNVSGIPYKIQFAIVETKNISNSACISSVVSNNSQDVTWQLAAGSCTQMSVSTDSTSCECTGSGYFGMTTNMYNLNWRLPEVVIESMSYPSYIGCGVSAILCIFTLILLIYVRTSSCTSLIHKHFAVASAVNTLSFMIGIGLIDDEAVCKTFAIGFHYFFLANFSWLMNEAFNLYYVVTYTAHNQASQASSSGARYYIIGWVLPALVVSIIVGVYFDDYFAPDMCWVDWNMIWLFVGPPLAIICVTLLVMTFAAKESNEMSYTKNEAANKLTEYHSRAVWTQIILLTMTWAFAMATLKFRGSVFKWVYMIFGCVQGAFFFVFYFLLNEEVRSVMKGKEIRRELGWEVTGIDDSMLFDCNDEAIPLTLKVKKEKAASESRKRSAKSVNPVSVTGKDIRVTLANPEELEDLMVTSI